MMYRPCGCLRPQPPRTLPRPVRGALPKEVRQPSWMASAGAQRVHSQQESWTTSCCRRQLPAPIRRKAFDTRLPYAEASASLATTSAMGELDRTPRTLPARKACWCSQTWVKAQYLMRWATGQAQGQAQLDWRSAAAVVAKHLARRSNAGHLAAETCCAGIGCRYGPAHHT